MDLLLSITVSLPTSRRPICLGSIPYFSRREVTTVKLKIGESISIETPHYAIRNTSLLLLKVKLKLRSVSNGHIQSNSQRLKVKSTYQYWPS